MTFYTTGLIIRILNINNKKMNAKELAKMYWSIDFLEKVIADTELKLDNEVSKLDDKEIDNYMELTK